MKHIKKFEKFLITENPDYVKLTNDKSVSTSGGQPFAFEPINYDGEENKTVALGNLGEYHGSLTGTGRNDGGSYPGRIWIKDKVISFWVYPKESEFRKYITMLEDRIGEKIWNNGYQLEIMTINGDKLDIDDNGDKYMKFVSGEQEVIPLEEYIGSKDVPVEQREIHLLSAEEKRKALKKMGYKPKKYPTPAGWSEAETRNKLSRYKFTESFVSFNDEWSIKRYGNTHAVYLDGVLVGFDDKSIGEDYNIKANFYNIELIYDQEHIEDFGLYVVDGTDVKQVAEKFAEKLYRQGFIVKII